MMRNLRAGLIGCGFFSRNHLFAWRETEGVEVVALCDADAAKVAQAAREFGTAAYRDPETMLREAGLDFVDIVTQVDSHEALVGLAADYQVPVICQKPLAADLATGSRMVERCGAAGIPFMVHENFRWQRAMREVQAAAAQVGPIFFARISFRSGFDVYRNQPYLATDPRFILFDLGVHLLDLARFFMGEVESLTCHTQRVNSKIVAEDVATVLLRMRSGATCVVDMSYASRPEAERFPQTLVHLEGASGTVSLGPDFQLIVTGPSGVSHQDVAPVTRPWFTGPGEAIQESVCNIHRHWRDCLVTHSEPETSGRDNVKTLKLVFDAYDSAGAPRTIAEGPD